MGDSFSSDEVSESEDTESDQESNSWHCHQCTFINRDTRSYCKMCHTHRKKCKDNVSVTDEDDDSSILSDSSSSREDSDSDDEFNSDSDDEFIQKGKKKMYHNIQRKKIIDNRNRKEK